MNGSALIIITGLGVDTFDGVDTEWDTGTSVIIPAGMHTLKRLLVIERTSSQDMGSYTIITYYGTDYYEYEITYEFEPGMTYEIDIGHRAVMVLDKPLGNVYITGDFGSDYTMGLRYRNTTGLQFGMLGGMSLVGNNIDMKLVAEANVGSGLWLADDLSGMSFGNFLGYMGIGFTYNFGGNMVFFIPVNNREESIAEDFGIGIGGGITFTWPAMLIEPEYANKPQPYVQLQVFFTERPRDPSYYGFYIDYYPGVTPWYSSIGFGFKGAIYIGL
jgi:hypothetical protein